MWALSARRGYASTLSLPPTCQAHVTARWYHLARLIKSFLAEEVCTPPTMLQKWLGAHTQVGYRVSKCTGSVHVRRVCTASAHQCIMTVVGHATVSTGSVGKVHTVLAIDATSSAHMPEMPLHLCELEYPRKSGGLPKKNFF